MSLKYSIYILINIHCIIYLMTSGSYVKKILRSMDLYEVRATPQ